METIVVIGANHAGTSALNTILDNYKDKKVIAIDSNSNISFLGCGMALWIGNQIDGSEGLFYSNKCILENKGATIYMETTVDSVNFEKKEVFYSGKHNGSIKYDKLIFATGSSPIIPKIDGIDLENVQYVKLFQHAEEVIKKLDNPAINSVTVVGAGYIGVELAEAFKRKGKSVSLVDIAPSCLSNYYDPEFTSEMADNLVKNGIKVHFGESVISIKGKTKVEAIVTNKSEIPCDMVVLAIGFRPNSALGGNLIERFKNGAYLVNKKQETNIKDVYAIGDCATVFDNSAEQYSYIALASNAVRTGIVAAHNVCENKVEGAGVQGSNGICIFDLKMVSTGLSESKAKAMGFEVKTSYFEDYQRPEFMKENEKVRIKLVYEAKSRRILGAQMSSLHDISLLIHTFSLAIAKKLTVDELALLDLFFLPHFNKPYNYVTMAALKAK